MIRVKVAISFLALVVITNCAFAQSSVVINEIMYAPASPEPEWIEIYNVDSVAHDLTDWQITDLSTSAKLPAIQISARGYLVLTKDSTALRTARPSAYPIAHIKLPSLNNSGDYVVLRNAASLRDDSLHYSPSMGGSSGRSLERRSYLRSSNDSGNWHSSTDTLGATPGQRNRITPAEIDIAIDSASMIARGDSLLLSVHLSNHGLVVAPSSTLSIWQSDPKSKLLSQEGVGPISVDSNVLLELQLSTIPSSAGLLLTIETPGDTSRSNDSLTISGSPMTLGRTVVINEIMAAPVKPEPEWIELLNASSDSVDISGWHLQVGHTVRILPLIPRPIPPDSMVILTSLDSALSTARQIQMDRIIQCPLPTLANAGSTISLRSGNGELIDTMQYSSAMSGRSSERIDYSASGEDTANWAQCTDTTGCTILRPNASRRLDHDLALGLISSDESIATFRVRNVGRDTVNSFAIQFMRQGFSDTLTTVSMRLAGREDTTITLPIPTDFYGSIRATIVVITDSDGRASNDSVRLVLSHAIPSDSIRINEIMYQPRIGSCEWIELYNASDRMMSLAGTSLQTGATALRETFPISTVQLPSHEYGVIAANSSVYTEHPELLSLHTIEVLGKSSLGLSNDSCKVVMHSESATSLDSLQYSSHWHSAAIADASGISLERKNWNAPTNDSTNWNSSFDASGSTPARANSHGFSAGLTSKVAQAQFSPNPISPDGDGFEDETTLEILTGDDNDYVARVRIFSANGRVVCTIADNTPIVRQLLILFDGKSDAGTYLTPGLYTALIELSPIEGNGAIVKKIGLIVAGKRQ